MYYVYRLIDPRNKLPFYIGKGKDNRMFKHEQYTKNGKYPNGNKKLYERILEIKSQNLDIIYEKIFETENENLAYKIENEKIKEIGIENLCNSIDDKTLIGIANNTKNSNWYYNEKIDKYRLFKKEDSIPDGYVKGSPRTKKAIENWWNTISEEELMEYKNKMSFSLKNSKKHKESVSTEDYKLKLSNGLKNSDKFKEYNDKRKGSKRGKYVESEKNISKRKSSILINSFGEVIKEFLSLKEVCEYFEIKVSTASIWIKNEKEINGLILKSK